MKEAVYASLLAAFLAHELDAVRRHEWRILPLLSRLPEAWGAGAFAWGHIPLLFALFWWDGPGVQAGIAAFAVVHVGLHLLLQRHPANEFGNASSWALILLTGLLGAAWWLVPG